MKIEHLEYIRSIAETHSFTLSAKKLFLTQPALSDAIRKLEDEIGGKLLYRTTRGTFLTPLGEILVQKSEKVFESLCELNDSLINFKDINNINSQKYLKIGSSMTCNNIFMPRFIKQFNQFYSDVIWTCYQLSVDELEKKIDNKQITFAIFNHLLYEGKTNVCSDRKRILTRRDLCNICFTSSPLIGVISRTSKFFKYLAQNENYPIEYVMQFPQIITYAHITSKIEIKDFILTYNTKNNDFIMHYFDAFVNVREAVKQGIGIYLCPKNLAQILFEKEDVEFINFTNTNAYYEFYLAWQKDSILSKYENKFLSIVTGQP